MKKINDKKLINGRMTSTQVMVLGFLAAILVGSLFLMLPGITAAGEHTDFLTALFTSTTSICVTGLVVVDTYSHWTFWGQLMILILIQIGGFGVITIYSGMMLMLKRNFTLRTRLLIQDYYNLNSIQGMIKFLKKVIKGTLFVEGVGAVLYSFVFIPKFGFLRGLWMSVFNAVSAFCNAGMDVIGPNSLMDYRDNIAINSITMFLIVVGGIGYVVWFDFITTAKSSIKHKYRFTVFCKKLSEHTKLVICLTLFFIVSGTLFILAFEWNNPETIGNLPLGNKILASLFQSITFRTAGFATIPQDALTPSSCLVGCIYMLIGGSPVGTAGGIKTVTIFVVVLNVFSFVRNRSETVVFNRSISADLINKANAILMVNLGLTFILFMALINVCDVTTMDAAYEIFSATGTVGLSRGLTANLNTAGRIIVIIGMYAGRIGPISMALFFSKSRSDKNNIKFSSGHYIVG